MKLCEVCGSPEHPAWRAHVFANAPRMANADVANTYRYRDPEKRRGYQRELMRKRRA